MWVQHRPLLEFSEFLHLPTNLRQVMLLTCCIPLANTLYQQILSLHHFVICRKRSPYLICREIIENEDHVLVIIVGNAAAFFRQQDQWGASGDKRLSYGGEHSCISGTLSSTVNEDGFQWDIALCVCECVSVSSRDWDESEICLWTCQHDGECLYVHINM